MEDLIYQEIMDESLKEVIVQVDLLKLDPINRPITIWTILVEGEDSSKRHLKIHASLFNYFMGSLELSVITKLVKTHNFAFNTNTKDEYLRNLKPFYDKLREHIGTITPDTLDKLYSRINFL